MLFWLGHRDSEPISNRRRLESGFKLTKYLNDKTKERSKSSLFVLWLGHRDSNPGNDGVRVRCLTAWRCPNIFNALYYSKILLLCQYLFSTFLKKLFFLFQKIIFGFTFSKICDTIHKQRNIYPWLSWIARQTPTLKVIGSNPIG